MDGAIDIESKDAVDDETAGADEAHLDTGLAHSLHRVDKTTQDGSDNVTDLNEAEHHES